MNALVVAALTLLGAVWGVSFALQRLAVPALGGDAVASGRLLLAAFAMLLFLRASGRKLALRERWTDYLALGTLNSALPFWLFAHASSMLPAGYLAVLNATTPLFTVLVLWARGTAPSASKLGGVLLGLFGVGLIAGLGSVALVGPALGAFGGGLIAALLYAIAALLVRQRYANDDPLVLATGSLVASALLLAPLGIASLPASLPDATPLLALALLGLVCTALAYALYFWLLRAAGPERAVSVTLIVPVFAYVFGLVLLGERVSLTGVIGGALVLLAVLLVFERLRWPKRRAPGPMPGYGARPRHRRRDAAVIALRVKLGPLVELGQLLSEARTRFGTDVHLTGKPRAKPCG
jgi:drug/metabolite transporter (DMT)-like permease